MDVSAIEDVCVKDSSQGLFTSSEAAHRSLTSHEGDNQLTSNQ